VLQLLNLPGLADEAEVAYKQVNYGPDVVFGSVVAGILGRAALYLRQHIV